MARGALIAPARADRVSADMSLAEGNGMAKMAAMLSSAHPAICHVFEKKEGAT
jgi:hypothetical protein